MEENTCPLLPDPEGIRDSDIVITETTYGDKTHEPFEKSIDLLADVVLRTATRGGKIVIPAFSVGRTQDLLFLLHGLVEQEKIPALPIFVDSPLSVNATSIYKMHHESFSEETQRLILHNENALGFNDATYITSTDESKRLNGYTGTCIIISASGMCEGGRVPHHIANNAGDKKNTILICGYQASETLGARLVNHARSIRIYGEDIPVHCEIEVLHGMSAHGDQHDLLNFIKLCNGTNLQKIFLVHGEPAVQTIFRNVLIENGFRNSFIPKHGEIANF